MSKILKIRSDRFSRAMYQWVGNGRRGVDRGVNTQMGLLVRDMIRITPPNQGRMSKAAGDNAIKGDLARVFTPQSDEGLERFAAFAGGSETSEEFGHSGAAPLGEVKIRILSRGEMAAWHGSRRKTNGRVMQVHRTVTTGLRRRDLRGLDTGLVRSADYRWYLQKTLGRVGWLAGGWNAAALLFKVRVPDWIARHGTGQGVSFQRKTGDHLQIHISNRVIFARDVKGLEHRVRAAAENRGKQMEKQTAHFLAMESPRRVGFRIFGGRLR